MMDLRRLQQDISDGTGDGGKPHRRLLPTLHVPFYVAVVDGSHADPSRVRAPAPSRLLKTTVALHLK